MKIIWLKLSFVKFSDSMFLAKARAIFTAMDGNVYFPKPDPPLDKVNAAIKAFSDALDAASSRDRYLIAEKNKCRKALEDILRQLGRHVMMVAGDDKTILMSAGFDVRKDPESTTVEPPQIISLATGKNPGEVIVKVTGTDAKSFIYEYTTDPLTDASVWTRMASTRRKFVFTGLKPVTRIWVRVTGIGAYDGEATSIAVPYVVQ